VVGDGAAQALQILRLSSSDDAVNRSHDLEWQLSAVTAKSAQAVAEHAEKQHISNQALSELNNNLIDHRRKLAALVDKHSSLELPIRNLTADQAAVPAKKLNDMSVAVEPEKQRVASV
jgi:hypothetical protein